MHKKKTYFLEVQKKGGKIGEKGEKKERKGKRKTKEIKKESIKKGEKEGEREKEKRYNEGTVQCRNCLDLIIVHAGSFMNMTIDKCVHKYTQNYK